MEFMTLCLSIHFNPTDVFLFLEVKLGWIKHCTECRKLVMGVHAKFTFASGQDQAPAKTQREKPQRIGFCYKIQLKIISWRDLIFHHIVIVHSNLLKRHLTRHGGVLIWRLYPPKQPTEWMWSLFNVAAAIQCKVFTTFTSPAAINCFWPPVLRRS